MGSSLCLGVGGFDLRWNGVSSWGVDVYHSLKPWKLGISFGLMHLMVRRRIQLPSINLLNFSLVTGIKSRGITLEMATILIDDL